MKIHPCIQGSREWLQLRLARPTASAFDRIVTPGGKPSSAQETYLRELLAEMIMGRPLETPSMPWMERGKDLEQQAVDFWEFQRDLKSTPVGFCTTDDETIGASPDRLVGDDGVLEIKCPSPSVHIGYLLFKDVSKTYRPQIQGELYVTGRKWVEICSYHPEMPPAIVHVERDEEFLKVLDVELKSFVYRLADKRVELDSQGMLHKPEPVAQHKDWITDEDVNAILAAQVTKFPPKHVIELRAWQATLGREAFLNVLGAHGYEDVNSVPATAFEAIQSAMLQVAKDLRISKESA